MSRFNGYILVGSLLAVACTGTEPTVNAPAGPANASIAAVAATQATASAVVSTAVALSSLVSDDTEAIQVLFDIAPYGDEGNSLYERLVERDVRRCMESAGFQYSEVPFTPRGDVVDALGLVPPLPDVRLLEQIGYESLSAPQLAPTSPEWKAAQALNEEGAQNADWAKAYAGDDTDGTPGCRTLAFKSITETADLRAQEAYSAIAPSIIGVLNGRSALQASSELQTATTSWSSCMADLGFAYESPQYAAAEFLDQPGTPPSDREVGVSKADIECRSESRYQEILLTAYAGLARTWTKENEGQVAELSQLAKRDIQAMKQLLQVSE